MKRLSLFIFLFVGISSFTFAQESEESTFKPSGTIIIRSFFDYSKGFGHVNDESGFDLTRAFLGYNYKFTRTLQARVLIDGAAGRTSDNKLDIYIRNAYINWQDYGFNIHVGEIGLLQFSLQDSYWRHRYVMKMFNDINKMGYSVDLGTTIQYTFNDKLSADLSITNGEGYKDVSQDNSMRYGLGLTVNPIKNTVFRIYGDLYNESKKMRGTLPINMLESKYRSQYNLGLFLGYQTEATSLGVEYNRIFNKDFIANKNYHGLSAYGSYKFAPKWGLYTRFDYTNSYTPDGFQHNWNKLDGKLIVAGIEFQPFKFLKISPNFRNRNPDNGRSEQYAFVNMEFNL